MKRLFKHGQLNPIPGDKTDQSRLHIEPNKSMDLSRAYDMARFRSETPKLSELNKSLETTKENPNNLSMSKATLDNTRIPKQKRAEDVRRSIDKKKSPEPIRTIDGESENDNLKPKKKINEKREIPPIEKQEVNQSALFLQL